MRFRANRAPLLGLRAQLSRRRLDEAGARVSIGRALVEEAHHAIVALSGPPVRLTLARLVENGIGGELRDLRDRDSGGLEFPARVRGARGRPADRGVQERP